MTLEDLYRALEPTEQRLGRKINPTIYTAADYERRRNTGNSFLTRLLAGPYIGLIGDPLGTATTR